MGFRFCFDFSGGRGMLSFLGGKQDIFASRFLFHETGRLGDFCHFSGQGPFKDTMAGVFVYSFQHVCGPAGPRYVIRRKRDTCPPLRVYC